MPSAPRQPEPRCAALACALVAAAMAGCGGGEDELTDFELDVPERPKTAEIALGRFIVPVPGQLLDAADQPYERNYLQLEFLLFGVVDPASESDAERLAERQRGELRDAVISVCRNASLKELQEPDVLTLKLRLIDAVEPLFEGVSFNTLLLSEYEIEAL